MDCRKVKANLPFFGDGSLDPATEQEMDRHMAHCPGCTEAYEEQLRVLRMVDVAYGNSAGLPAGIDLTDAIHRGIAARKHGRGFMRYLAPAAAAAVLVISVVLHGTMSTGPGMMPEMAEIDQDAYYAYIGEYFVSSYDFLANADYLSDYFASAEYNNIDAETLVESGFVDPSTEDLLGSLDEDTMNTLFEQMLY